MEIRPQSIPSVAAPPQGRKEAEQLVRDVVQTGAQIQAPQTFLAFWTRYRPLTPEKAAEELLQGPVELRIQTGGLEPLPLRTLEDLEEAAIFQKVLPAPEGSTPERLLALAERGMRYYGAQGKEIGPYGAYNALTDPGHNLGPLMASNPNGAIPLLDEQRLGELHEFTLSSPLAGIEGQGFQFFDREGRAQPAFLAQNGQVGTDGVVWLEVGDPATLEQRLQTFTGRLERVDGDLDLARRLESVTPDSLPGSLESLQGKRREVLARAALQEMGPDSLMQAQPDTPEDLQRLWLEVAATSHEGAAVALQVHQTAPLARQKAWEEALRLPDDGLELARTLLAGTDRMGWDQRQQLVQGLLSGLARCQATQTGASAMQSWQVQDPTEGLAALLANPRVTVLELARQGIPSWDAEAQHRAMADLSGPLAAPLRELHGNLKNDNARHVVFQLASQQPPDELKTYQQLLRELQGQSLDWDDRNSAGAFLLTRLSHLPETVRASAAARSWQSQDPFQAAQIVMDDPSRSVDELALRAITAWDTEGQQRHMQSLKGPMAAPLRELHRELENSNLRHLVFQLACQNPADEPKTQQALLRGAEGISMEWDDRNRLGSFALERLSQLPETARAATAARSWQPEDPFQAARIVLEDPTRSEDAIALRAITAWDTEGQQRYLQGLTGPMAAPLRELHRQLETSNVRHLVFQIACQNPADEPKTQQALLSGAEGISMEWDDRNRLGSFALERLSQLPETARAATAARSWQPEDPFQAARIVLEDPTRSEDAIALRAITAWDTEGQQRYLQGLTGPMAAPLRELHRQLQTSNIRHLVFQLACQNPADEPKTQQALLRGAEGISMEWDDRNRLGSFALERLSQLPETARAATAARSWQPEDPFQAARIVLEDPTRSEDAIALRAITAWDTEGQQRYLQGLTGPMAAPLRDLHRQLETSNVRHLVFQLACQNPADEPETQQALLSGAEGISMEWEDRNRLGSFALARLGQLPETARAATAARSWQPQDPFQAARIVLEDPTRSEDEIARRAITSWDTESQQRYMQGLQGPLTAPLLALHASLKHSNNQYEVFQLASRNPQGATGKELAPAFLQLFQALEGKPATWEDRPVLGNFVLDQLAARPDTSAAAQTVRQWKLSDPYEAARALSEHPELTTPQELDALALAAISSWDTEAQKNHLSMLAARPDAPAWLSRLQAVHARLEGDEASSAVWRLAAQGSLGNLSDLADQLQSISMSSEDRQVLDALVRDIQAEIETRKLVSGFQEKTQSVAVEEERVVVGGVVLRRKHEKHPAG